LESVTAQAEGLRGNSAKVKLTILLLQVPHETVDCALWDRDKQAGKRVWELWTFWTGGDRPIRCRSLDTPGGDARAGRRHSLDRLKIKPAHRRHAKTLRLRRAPKSTIIVDANEGQRKFADLAPHLRVLVALVEQPLSAGQDDALIGMDRPVPVC
jgi:L-alanine-DL-glutamate epimerase-like enolase superfamily enzyme